MSATAGGARSTAAGRRANQSPLSAGWLIVASKELADHLLSVRFFVLLLVLGAAAVIPLYFAAERLRSLASDISGLQAVFLALFTVTPEGVPDFRVDVFVGIAAPLLGIGFAFDAVNGERSEGTLPRLLSQPIHRDDVVNGKFAAGLIVIALVLLAVMVAIAGFGLARLGIVPAASEVMRLVLWYLVTVLYVALWLAFGLLLSVVIRRGATAALAGFGVWLFVAIPYFGPRFISAILGIFLRPVSGEEVLGAQGLQEFVLRFLPSRLYAEASIVLLNPAVTTVSTPATLDQYLQLQQQIPTLVSLDQSLLIIWPHVVVLLALTVGCFALAYAQFMRQEVRA
jgi:ABC-2 type transport system permease protein